MAVSIYVGNLSFSTNERTLQELFGNYGEVISANVISDRETGRSRGFGFVEMADEASAREAISALNGAECDGRNLKVNESQPREQRPQGGNRSRRY